MFRVITKRMGNWVKKCNDDMNKSCHGKQGLIHGTWVKKHEMNQLGVDSCTKKTLYIEHSEDTCGVC